MMILNLDKKPAHWASINNAIYLCRHCSGEHRGLGVGVSYIRSITLDQWNENQVKLLQQGGNKRLTDFLKYCGIPRTLPKKQLYNSKILNFYRKLLKAEANNEILSQEMPGKREMLDAYNYKESDSSNNFNTMKINISDNHYKNYSSVSSDDNGNKYNNSNNKFTSISSSYGNDSRFASVSSEPINNSDDGDNSNSNTAKIFSLFGNAFSKTKEIAYLVTEKVGEMDFTNKLKYTGSKAIEVIKYTGEKVYETSSDIAVRIYFLTF